MLRLAEAQRSKRGKRFVNQAVLAQGTNPLVMRDWRASMIIEFFLKWVQTASAQERAAASAALARAFCRGELAFEERCAAESALTFLVDDPSVRVRLALADALSLSPHAPVQVIAALAADQPEVASIVLARSPLLHDHDLNERLATASSVMQCVIAARASVSMSVAAVIAEIGDAEACETLLGNEGASIAALSFRRMTARLGHLPRMRHLLTCDDRLPIECRHELMEKLSASFQASPFVARLIGPHRTERVLADACGKSVLTLIDSTPEAEHPALVEHLRLRGVLTVAVIVRMVAMGQIDFLGASLVSLAGQDPERVRSVLASGHSAALTALFKKAGLPPLINAALLRALAAWREVAMKRRVAGVQEVSFMMLQETEREPALMDLSRLLKSIHLEALRFNARRHALTLAAA